MDKGTQLVPFLANIVNMRVERESTVDCHTQVFCTVNTPEDLAVDYIIGQDRFLFQGD